MRRIAVVNQKGGCGKTTTAINLAMSLALRQKRVLLIDLDPQGHIAAGLGTQAADTEKSIYEVLLGEISLGEAVQPLRENLDGVLSDILLSGFEQVMAGVEGRESKLAECVGAIGDSYDFLIIDSPPCLGLLTVNGLLAAEELIIPVDASFYALKGLGRLIETVQMIQDSLAHEFTVRLLAANIDRRTKYGRKLVSMLQSRFPENFYKTFVNSCTGIKESSSLGKSIHEHNRRSAAFRDFESLADEILQGRPASNLASFDCQGLASGDFFLELPSNLSGCDETADRDGKKLVEFAVEAPAEADVKIAGSFNDWLPESLTCSKPNGAYRWHKSFPLRPGVYEYKFVINGQWIPDAANDFAVDDAFGGANSVVQV